jgi:hypothetical protein
MLEVFTSTISARLSSDPKNSLQDPQSTLLMVEYVCGLRRRERWLRGNIETHSATCFLEKGFVLCAAVITPRVARTAVYAIRNRLRLLLYAHNASLTKECRRRWQSQVGHQ